MEPVVTIGVCVRNSACTIREAIVSIVGQDFPHELMEIILVDDGSEDATLAIAENHVSRMDIRAKIFHTEWRGLGPARNTVVDNAEGEYIIWVDGDMRLPNDHVRKQIEFMEQNPRVGIAKAKYRLVPTDSTVATLEKVPLIIHDAKPGIMDRKLPGTGGAIYRVKALRQVRGFDDSLRGAGEDQDAAYRIRAAGWLLDHSPAVFYEEGVRTWKALWDKYLWYGYGNHDLHRKNRDIFSLHRMNPIAGFVAGILHVPVAYRVVARRDVFLLPFHHALKMIAWLLGFTEAHLYQIRAKPPTWER